MFRNSDFQFCHQEHISNNAQGANNRKHASVLALQWQSFLLAWEGLVCDVQAPDAVVARVGELRRNTFTLSFRNNPFTNINKKLVTDVYHAMGNTTPHLKQLGAKWAR